MNTSRLLKCNKLRDFWRVVNRAKSGDKHECKVAIENLEEYYEEKFKECETKTEKMINCENIVANKHSSLENINFSSVMMTEADVIKCIRLLTCDKSPGTDGVTTEHYLHGLESSLPLHISTVLTLCLRHVVVVVQVGCTSQCYWLLQTSFVRVCQIWLKTH